MTSEVWSFDFTGVEAEFNGAPTDISQRWPGCPCAGFKATPSGALFVTGVVVSVVEVFSSVLGFSLQEYAKSIAAENSITEIFFVFFKFIFFNFYV
jgi:hypothetical protein